MTMSAGLRKIVLVVHVTTSVGLLGAVACFLALALAGLRAGDPHVAAFAYPAMNMITEFVILPLALASLIIGIVPSLTTPWGLLRHYWIVVKLLLTAVTVVVLLFQLDSIAQLAALATERRLSADDFGLQMRVVIHAASGLLVLLASTILSIYKPRGVTRYGTRQQRAQDPFAPI